MQTNDTSPINHVSAYLKMYVWWLFLSPTIQQWINVMPPSEQKEWITQNQIQIFVDICENSSSVQQFIIYPAFGHFGAIRFYYFIKYYILPSFKKLGFSVSVLHSECRMWCLQRNMLGLVKDFYLMSIEELNLRRQNQFKSNSEFW